MPFCYHCGKGVESEWNVCPFCTKPTQGINQDNQLNVRDSVVSDSNITNVTNTNIIDNTVKQNTQTCPGCNATGNIHPRLCLIVVDDVQCKNYICEFCARKEHMFARYLSCIDCNDSAQSKFCVMCNQKHKRYVRKCACGSRKFTIPEIVF